MPPYLFFHADMFPPPPTHTQKLADGGGRKGHRAEWSVTSKIDIRIYSEVDTNGFLSGEQEEDKGTEELEECRVWLLLE